MFLLNLARHLFSQPLLRLSETSLVANLNQWLVLLDNELADLLDSELLIYLYRA